MNSTLTPKPAAFHLNGAGQRFSFSLGRLRAVLSSTSGSQMDTDNAFQSILLNLQVHAFEGQNILSGMFNIGFTV